MLPKLDAPHTVRCILPGTAQKGSTPLRRRNQLMKTAFFPPKILNHLPADNFEALAALCAEFERFDGHARQMPEHHDDYVEALSILRAFATAREAKVAAFPELGQVLVPEYEAEAVLAHFDQHARDIARQEQVALVEVEEVRTLRMEPPHRMKEY